MITVANRIYVTQEHADAFEQSFVSVQAWWTRKAEKELARSDELARRREELPRVRVDKEQVIDDCRLTIGRLVDRPWLLNHV